MEARSIQLFGFNIEVHNFGKRSFYYPSFNGNAEFEVSSKGFRQLSHYLRTVKYFDAIVKDCESKLFA